MKDMGITPPWEIEERKAEALAAKTPTKFLDIRHSNNTQTAVIVAIALALILSSLQILNRRVGVF